MKSLALQIAFVAIAISHWASSLIADETFAKNIAPILQDHCFSCHNDESSKGGFSLQSRKSAFKDEHIVSGDAASSHLVDLVRPVDGQAEMPKDANPLSQKEIASLVKWIDEGAGWPEDFQLSEPAVTDFDWWSYQPIRRPSVPSATDEWVRTPIDAFVLKTLNSKGLTRSEPADRRTLIRRVVFDLTGLPPSPEEVRAFVDDEDPQSYEKLVDRLLESKHYGERWARHWLDVVKYGDTCGYDKDKLRNNAWPYRDYVIRSLNEDKPYSRFIQEQLAGDVLFPGQPDGILGLGFIAAGPWDFIGHVEVSESKIDGKVARNLDRDDMVSNTINTFCSLTVQCARCHNHKFDPITQDDYYALQSIFAAVDRAERIYDTNPKIEAKRNELTKQLSSAQKRLKKVSDEITKAGGTRLRDVLIEIGGIESIANNKPVEYGYHSQISKSQETIKWVEVDLGRPTKIDRIVLNPCDDDFAGIGAGFGFPLRFKIEARNSEQEWILVQDHTAADVTNTGLVAFEIENANVTASVIRLTATKLAERKNDYILAIAELQAFDVDGTNHAAGRPVRSLDSIQAMPRWARKNLTDDRWPFAIDPATSENLARLQEERDALMAQAETPERVNRREQASADVKRLGESIKALPKGKMVYAAATHFKPQGNFKPTEGKLRPIHVLHRGNVQQPKHAASVAAIPLPGNDGRIDALKDEAQRRAALAKWLTAEDHPLVWRSIVNRIWQYHFGSGIVATPNDFGRMGARPTHPELLDWLAAEFRDGGQTMKRLHRLIVTSNVYRQSSAPNAANENIDGSNQYLWRMPRRRLSAEEIRDSVLSVSGVLDTKMGGPGFYLFALERTEHSPHYEYHKFDPSDPNSHRRSVYRFIARSQPDPWMTTLDCADSSQSTPKRNETLTSLQALSMMNNRFNLAMARSFADSVAAEHASIDEQLRLAFQRVSQRDPTEEELTELLSYANVHGLANACRFLFSLSEFVFLD